MSTYNVIQDNDEQVEETGFFTMVADHYDDTMDTTYPDPLFDTTFMMDTMTKQFTLK